MIRKLSLKGFKNIQNEEFIMKPITVLTGLNSTGKSSVLQSVLVLNKEITLNGIRYLDSVNSAFSTLRNIYINARKISITCETDKGTVDYQFTSDNKSISPEHYEGIIPEFEKELFYLSTNRIGVENDATLSAAWVCGMDGRFCMARMSVKNHASWIIH